MNKQERKKYHKEYYLNNKEYFTQYLLINKEKIKERNKEYRLNNKKKIKTYQKEYSLKNKEFTKKYSKEYRLKNKEKINEERKEYRLNNKEYFKEYRLKNKKQIKEYTLKNKEHRNKKHKIRNKIDFNYKMRRNLSSRVYSALKNSVKSASTMKLIGCSVDDLWNHLESKFKPWMTKENYGLWHVDHVKACAKFDLTCPEQQRVCFHYTNLQPMEAIENMRKGAR